MCGISGYISNKDFLENNNIKNTLNLMKEGVQIHKIFFQKKLPK